MGSVGENVKDIFINNVNDIEFERLAEFNREVYKGEFNAERFTDRNAISRLWKWKYANNPASRHTDNFGWLANYQSDLIGQFHVIPTYVKVGNNYYRAAWAANLAMLKKYRKMGVGSFLVKHAVDRIAGDFTFFLVGGMNTPSYSIFKKCGLVDLGRIPRHIKILDLTALLNCFKVPGVLSSAVQKIINIACKIIFFLKIPRKHSINTEIVDNLDKEFEKFWESISEQYSCIAKRDVTFLRWRYVEQPLWPYAIMRVKRKNTMKGFAVLREGEVKSGRLKRKKIGVISDILVDPQDGEAVRGLLKAITEYFKNKKVLLIKCDILDRKIEKALRTSGFIKVKPGNGFMIRICRKNIPENDIRLASSRESWHLTSGDSDMDFY